MDERNLAHCVSASAVRRVGARALEGARAAKARNGGMPPEGETRAPALSGLLAGDPIATFVSEINCQRSSGPTQVLPLPAERPHGLGMIHPAVWARKQGVAHGI